MEPNEMEVWDLGKGMGEWERSRVNPDGKWVRYSDAMQVITALQSQIDGMIKRPVIEWKYDRGYPTLFVNGVYVATSQDDKRRDCDKWNEDNMRCEMVRLTTALGMDDAKEGGGG